MAKSKNKISAILLIVLAGVLALSTLFSPDFYDSTEKLKTDELFLEPGNVISFRYDDIDQGHMLGESFYITAKVQYDTDSIEVFPDSLERTDYRPFETTGNISYEIKSIPDPKRNIEQLTYSVELVAIQAIPGESYPIEVMMLSFTRQRGDETGDYRINIAPEARFFVGSYWGGNYDGAVLRPMKGKIESTLDSKQIVYLAALGALLLAALLPAGSYALNTIRKKKNNKSVLTPETKLFRDLERYADKEWLRQDSADERMFKLERLAFTVADEYDLVESLEQFWSATEDNPHWREMLECFEAAYAPQGVDYELVNKAAILVKKLIVQRVAKTIPRDRFKKYTPNKRERRGK